jgi:hypothetical protein
VLNLPQGVGVSPAEIRRRALLACRRPWQDLLADHPGFMPYRAQRACFGAAYVYAILTDIYGIAPDDDDAFLPVDQVPLIPPPYPPPAPDAVLFRAYRRGGGAFRWSRSAS